MEWIKVFNSAEEAETAIPITRTRQLVLNERKICLARTRTGFYAVADACPHLGESLSKGTTNYLNEVICPWHSYRYHLISGEECKNRTRSAETFPVEIREDGLYLGIPGKADLD